jgi:hypothetical protein
VDWLEEPSLGVPSAGNCGVVDRPTAVWRADAASDAADLAAGIIAADAVSANCDPTMVIAAAFETARFERSLEAARRALLRLRVASRDTVDVYGYQR